MPAPQVRCQRPGVRCQARGGVPGRPAGPARASPGPLTRAARPDPGLSTAGRRPPQQHRPRRPQGNHDLHGQPPGTAGALRTVLSVERPQLRRTQIGGVRPETPRYPSEGIFKDGSCRQVEREIHWWRTTASTSPSANDSRGPARFRFGCWSSMSSAPSPGWPLGCTAGPPVRRTDPASSAAGCCSSSDTAPPALGCRPGTLHTARPRASAQRRSPIKISILKAGRAGFALGRK